MKVGDYVRFYDRDWTEIGQITGYVEDSHLKVVKCKDGYYDLDGFIKSSPNIIDLIEVGDYVNGVLVESIYKREKDKLYIHSFDTEIMMGFTNNNIKSIATKEQFESIEYKIGE